MNRSRIVLVLLVALLLNLAAFAQKEKSDAGTGGIDITGEINGAPFRLVRPASWNGTLIVYGHGYRDKADHPGEPNNRNPDIAPDPALISVLTGQGYALAGSAYADNGWAVQEGYNDTLSLVNYFKANVGTPNRTLYWGFSMGSVIGFKLAETSSVFDGLMCGCAVGAGATSSWDGAGDLLLAYDTVFGMTATWGNPGDLRDDIDFETEVFPKLSSELNSPANFPGFEFMRLVVGTPGRGINPPAPPSFYPGWVVTDMFFTTEARSELERRAGGAVVQNLDRNYNLTANERLYLNGLGVPNAQIDAWISAMNNRRTFNAPESARNYLRQNANYNGAIRSPVLTMHTKIDPLVTVSQEWAYQNTVAAAGRPNWFISMRNSPGGVYDPRSFLRRTDLLYQTYTNGNGHCSFTGEQLITAITTLDNWIATRTKPTSANFPEALGFDNSFVPPPLVQP
ncbi:MAG: hypothetical protein KIS76_07010 [Pyrinomonadaceae bacterium]|nr:hypothetical protein [Pyrinomonadaceae bacterium]